MCINYTWVEWSFKSCALNVRFLFNLKQLVQSKEVPMWSQHDISCSLDLPEDYLECLISFRSKITGLFWVTFCFVSRRRSQFTSAFTSVFQVHPIKPSRIYTAAFSAVLTSVLLLFSGSQPFSTCWQRVRLQQKISPSAPLTQMKAECPFQMNAMISSANSTNLPGMGSHPSRIIHTSHL